MTRREAFDVDAMAARLLAMYESAPADLVAAGDRWYTDARRSIRELAQRYSLPARTVAGIVAALSPQCPWSDNLARAEACIRGERVNATRERIGKASAILQGADPTDVLSGPKVRAFFVNLTDPRDVDTVTIDTHAVRAALGERVAKFDGSSAVRAQRAIVDAYRRARDAAGMRHAYRFQAIVWCVQRGSAA